MSHVWLKNKQSNIFWNISLLTVQSTQNQLSFGTVWSIVLLTYIVGKKNLPIPFLLIWPRKRNNFDVLNVTIFLPYTVFLFTNWLLNSSYITFLLLDSMHVQLTSFFFWYINVDTFQPFVLVSYFYVQYYKQTEAYKVTLHYMNTTLTGLFTLECVMKIFSFGFRVRSS